MCIGVKRNADVKRMVFEALLRTRGSTIQTRLFEAYSFRQIVNLDDPEVDRNAPDESMFYFCAGYQICQEGKFFQEVHILSYNEELVDPYELRKTPRPTSTRDLMAPYLDQYNKSWG